MAPVVDHVHIPGQVGRNRVVTPIGRRFALRCWAGWPRVYAWTQCWSGEGPAVRTVTILVITAALCLAATPLAWPVLPRALPSSPMLSGAAFAIALLTAVGGAALLVGARRRRPSPGRHAVADAEPSVDEPRVESSPDGRVPDAWVPDGWVPGCAQPSQEPVTAGQPSTGASHTQAQQGSSPPPSSIAVRTRTRR